jgi:hypothetical protein
VGDRAKTAMRREYHPQVPRLSPRLVASVTIAAFGAALSGCRDEAPAPRAPETPTVPPAQAAPTMLNVGDPAPSARVKDQDGRERSLVEFRGKRVVLWFFPKADTGG